MVKIEIPDDLKGLIRDDYKVNTPYNDGLITLFGYLFDDYFSPFPIKATDGFFQKLADDIIEYVGIPNYLRETTLRNLYYPDRATKNKETLIHVYKFLDISLKEKTNGERDGKYWIGKIKEKKAIPGKAIKPEDDYDPNLKGATLINSKVISSINKLHFSPTEFYTAKEDDNCQWFGIAQRWDAKRRDYDSIKEAIFESFILKGDNQVAVVICGEEGCGRSTFLRRISWDFGKTKFLTFWITDLILLNIDVEKVVKDTDHQYLFVLDGWPEQGIKLDAAKTFLKKTYQYIHIRIVIGDYNTILKDYLGFFNEKHTYFLSPNENKDIIRSVLAINKEWKNDSLFDRDNIEFFESKLYLILFVLARLNCRETGSSYGENSFKSQFREIVRNDLRKINSIYPGLAQIFFLWACIKKEYHYTPTITWEAFLKIAESYNGDRKLSDKFLYLNKNNPIIRVISNYIFFRPLVNPAYNEARLFFFHHPILEEGFDQQVDENWYYDNDIKLEIIKILIRVGEIRCAYSMYDIFDNISSIYEHNKLVFKDDNEKNLIVSKIKMREVASSNFAYMVDKEILDAYENATGNKDDFYWKEKINIFLFFFGIFLDSKDNDNEVFKTVLKTLIDNGCNVPHVLHTYGLALNNKIQFYTV